jgi:hypothetical protein
MPGRALQLVLEWMELHREELVNLWKRAQNGDPLYKIDLLK